MLPEAAVINRSRRRLLISSAAALVSGVGLSGPLQRTATAQQRNDQSPPGVPPAGQAAPPIFVPKPAWLGTFTPSSLNMTPSSSATVSASAVGPADAILPPNVRSREAWGAAPPVQPYVSQTPKGVSLHHTGSPWHGSPGPEQYLKNIQHFHTGPQREWEDIAYHYLVDLDGVIWAGRPPTVRGNPSIYYDPTGLVLISFLGDFSVQEPSEAQLKSSAETAAWLMKKYAMPSTTVTGHRDHAPTTCPGDNLYRLLQDGSFERRVREALSKLS